MVLDPCWVVVFLNYNKVFKKHLCYKTNKQILFIRSVWRCWYLYNLMAFTRCCVQKKNTTTGRRPCSVSSLKRNISLRLHSQHLQLLHCENSWTLTTTTTKKLLGVYNVHTGHAGPRNSHLSRQVYSALKYKKNVEKNCTCDQKWGEMDPTHYGQLIRRQAQTLYIQWKNKQKTVNYTRNTVMCATTKSPGISRKSNAAPWKKLSKWVWKTVSKRDQRCNEKAHYHH